VLCNGWRSEEVLQAERERLGRPDLLGYFPEVTNNKASAVREQICDHPFARVRDTQPDLHSAQEYWGSRHRSHQASGQLRAAGSRRRGHRNLGDSNSDAACRSQSAHSRENLLIIDNPIGVR